MDKRVEGSYETVAQAFDAVDRLKEQGYGRDDIYVVANAAVRDTIPFTMDAEVSTDTSIEDTDENRSFWDKIKDAFTFEDNDESRYDDPDYNADSDPLHSYRDDLNKGNILVLVDDDATLSENEAGTLTTPVDPVFGDTTTGTMDDPLTRHPDLGLEDDVKATDPPLNADLMTDPPLDNDDMLTPGLVDTEPGLMDTPPLTDEDDTLQLKEERLDVNTEEVQTGDVRLHKHVTEETQSVDVPVSHDEVTIERRPVTDHHSTNESISEFGESEEIIIPITEEQVDVSKHTDVVEEVVIRKDRVTEEKKVTDTVRKEELDVEGDGQVHLEDETDDLDRPL